MRNVAGEPPQMSLHILSQELEEADIPTEGVPIYGEGNCPVIGVMKFKHNAAVFVRASYYWIVALAEPMSEEDAELINKDFFKEIRVHGHAGGHKADGPISTWHVDSQKGLNALASHFRTIFGEPTNKSRNVTIRINGLHYDRENLEINTIPTINGEFHWTTLWNRQIPLIKKTILRNSYSFQTVVTPEDKREILKAMLEVISLREQDATPIQDKNPQILKESVKLLVHEDTYSKTLVDSTPHQWTHVCFSDLKEEKDRKHHFSYYRKLYEEELAKLTEKEPKNG